MANHGIDRQGHSGTAVDRMPPPPRPEDRIPERCPACNVPLVPAGDALTCPRCGVRSDHPLAARLREIDVDLAELSWERTELIDRMWRDRLPPAEPIPPPERLPSPPTRRRSLSVQAILVGLGAFLVVVAGAIFAVVTWEQLGAAGQAAVLVVATATAGGVTLAAARANLTATAEALGVVSAGFAFLDVHAVRTAVAPEGDWQTTWAVGIVFVVAGLLVFGRAAGLRSPAIIAVSAAQLPLVFLASLADRTSLAIASAFVITAALDLLAASVVLAKQRKWLPAPAPSMLRPLAAVTWVMGVVLATPWALGGETVDARWWAVGVLVGATAVSGATSWSGRPKEKLAVAAASGTVLAGLLAVVGTGRQATEDAEVLLLLANASAAVVLAGFLAVSATGRREADRGREPDVPRDPRVAAGSIAAAAWAGMSLLPWTGPVIGSIMAPFVALAEDGWWTRGFSVMTGELGLEPLPGQAPDADSPSAGLVLTAVGVGTVAVVTAIRLAMCRPSGVRRAAEALATGAGLFAAVSVVGALSDVPVAALVVVYLLAAAVPLAGAIRSDLRHGSWFAVAAVPAAASAIAWAGNVEVLTVLTLGALTILGAVLVAAGLAKHRRPLTGAATVATGVALAGTASTMGLALGVADSTAWILAIAAGAVGSGMAWVADRRAPWWAPSVDITSAVLVGGALLGLAGAGEPDPLSIGLLIIVVTAAAHATRPSRRAIAGMVAAVAGLALWWLRLWEADIRMVEAYSLPAAAVAIGIGWWQLRRHPGLGSWRTLGPALVIAAIPSVVVAISEPDVLRPLLLLAAATAVTIAGARLQLRAPFAVGALTVLVIAVDQLFPAVARLPRWSVIGTAGILLLAVGATFERQRRRAVGLYEHYRQLR